jgi:hypothetical protein
MRNVNKRNKHMIFGENYSWPALLAIVKRSLVEQGYSYVTGAMSMAIVIRSLDSYKCKYKDTDSIILEYARHVLKQRLAA